MLRHKERRFGRFSISGDVIERLPSLALQMLDGVIIVRAEYMLATDAIDYVGVSYAFQVVETHEPIPLYEARVEMHGRDAAAKAQFIGWVRQP